MPLNSYGTSENSPTQQYLLSLPPAVLIKYLKSHPEKMKTIFHGFTPRDRSLAIPVVKLRLQQEIDKSSEMATDIANLWKKQFNQLLQQLAEETYSPTPERWLSLLGKYGEAALNTAFTLQNRQDWQEYAGHSPSLNPEIPKPKSTKTPVVVTNAPAPTGTGKALQQQIDKLQQNLTDTAQKLAQEQRKSSEYELVINKLKAEIKMQVSQMAELEKKLTREIRRVKKAEEALASSEKLRQQEKAKTNKQTLPINRSTTASSAEITTLLQQAISLLNAENVSSAPAVTTPLPPLPKTKPATGKTTIIKPAPAPIADIILPGARGELRFKTSTIISGLQANNEVLLAQLRDGIARLDGDKRKQHAALAQLTKAGVPDVLMNAPLRIAVIDGSNVARINAENSKGKLNYILQAQKSAWREGYFPVKIIIDASLRYHIDFPDKLDELVDQGIFYMSEAGTSADKILIDEAIARHAVLITNDRMNDWPDAAELEKRHVKLISGVATITDFHNSLNNWFR